MLIDNKPIRVEIPNEPNQWMEFRRLSYKAFKAARKAQQGENLEVIKALGGEFVKAMQKGDPTEEARVRSRMRELEYDRSNFDAAVLLHESLMAWSYRDGDDKPLGIEEAGSLITESTMVWAADRIIAISRPPTEAEAKNV